MKAERAEAVSERGLFCAWQASEPIVESVLPRIEPRRGDLVGRTHRVGETGAVRRRDCETTMRAAGALLAGGLDLARAGGAVGGVRVARCMAQHPAHTCALHGRHAAHDIESERQERSLTSTAACNQ